ncbi:MAG: adventurous gliding motility lipoprotein CglD [Myxococcales bacterium]|nr:adventurous gliding motility lipoprotein CglD [Myxococcales bacterium]
MRTTLLVQVFAAALFVSACDCGTKPPVNEDGGAGGEAGGSSGTGGGDAGGSSGTGGGESDAGRRVDPNDPLNDQRDTDCDGLTDAEEFGNVYPGGQRTDPSNPDTDGDGVLDGVEVGKLMSVEARCSFMGDADPGSRTIPTVADTDGDGLSDGLEDANHNGRTEPTETDPTTNDTDQDTLSDGAEDANRNGMVDMGETDPRLRDTDGDRIADGIELTVTLTNPTNRDSDGDTCQDGAEDFNQNGVVDTGETNPNLATDCGPAVNPDADNDGLPNTIEDKNRNGMVDPGETDPMRADTDGDGISDGVEDTNKNGFFEAGETNPLRVDTDCDGLLDGPSAARADGGMVRGEDLNANGIVDMGETDPRKRDSDGDGITDGVELGLTAATIADPTNCTNVPVDADPTTTTNPTNRDTDGDGIDDGAEDTNQNGRVDPGELNPNDMADGMGPAGQACTRTNLRPVLFRSEADPDLQLGLPATFTEVSPIVVTGQRRGVMGFDPTNQVAFVVWREAARGGAMNPIADETALRPLFNGVGAVSNVTTQQFTTWDNLPSAQAFYDMAGATDVKTRANAIANALVGMNGGSLMGSGTGMGPFRVQLQIIHRTNAAVVVMAALTPIANFTGAPLFTISDTAGGSAIAQFGDDNASQCEVFTPGNAKVDFLFVVDDSCSMATSQNALAATATQMTAQLSNSSLDWRVGLVTTSYRSGGTSTTNNNNALRGFTRDVDQFRAWLTRNSTCNAMRCNTVTPTPPATMGPACNPTGASGGCWVGTGGSGDERSLESAARAVQNITPATMMEQANRLREGAQLVIVLLGDADDQSARNAAEFTTFFTTANANISFGSNTYQNRTGGRIVVHGIVCPQGSTCNAEPNNNKHGQVISATGGVRGDLCNPRMGNTAADCSVFPSIPVAVPNIVTSAIAAAGYRMQKPPIGASVKVAMSNVVDMAMCNPNDLPRSRMNGFDFDGINRTLSFFGACRPAGAMNRAAVSYRYWIDVTPMPGGNPPPCVNDPNYDPTDTDFCRGRLACNRTNGVCECPQDCGGNGPPGTICNTNPQVCDFVCTADCGGTCSSFQQCNTTSCSCDCRQMFTCPAGFRFANSGGQCGCVCDTAALNCGPSYDADPATCACTCKSDCGGCSGGQTCNRSVCSCGGGIN